MTDGRLRELSKLVASGRYDVLSLDLFDTVIYRCVPAPKDVFFLLGRAGLMPTALGVAFLL